jgi:hypothetical protein
MKLHQRLNCKLEGIAVSVHLEFEFVELCQAKIDSVTALDPELVPSRLLGKWTGITDCHATKSSDERYAAKEIAEMPSVSKTSQISFLKEEVSLQFLVSEQSRTALEPKGD